MSYRKMIAREEYDHAARELGRALARIEVLEGELEASNDESGLRYLRGVVMRFAQTSDELAAKNAKLEVKITSLINANAALASELAEQILLMKGQRQ